ncbi:hypothetical protein HYPBUDRAFT_10763 [Hyphopichia burtonii NRRL Y-1933]|uniref:AMP-dependent synthetase/ligase domain-containing protein n=1 Tax=Hyphopichia burtonii NRRL Y-1933 TaxID=984485 RepID=A0A1E4RJV6_9ASCO|nr:hypothetical protein HYPBUDRAFT_10763 [Hyphopichia burtonii NRRL Y-1933]ODV67558.1 hypothetical protein HYPBUDRAFT_10763 [Hyphopichia burtonii NRRL Y-1933]
MTDNSNLYSILSTVITILVINYIYNQYIESTKDVSDVYLSQQSSIDAVRLPEESPIYKSNKLDYSNGLRIGLDIRYDHYKLRNGNLCDVWEVLINQLKQKPANKIQINDESMFVSQINYRVHQFSHYLAAKKISQVFINQKHFLTSFDSLIVMIACFLTQVTVNVYDDFKNVVEEEGMAIFSPEEAETNKVDHLVLGSEEMNRIFKPFNEDELTTFTNEYHFSKDKGIALRITRKTNPKIITSVDFTQSNIISSVASTIKHLPMSKELNSQDRVLVVQLTSKIVKNEDMLNDLVKCLVTFISNSELVITNSDKLSIEKVNQIQPTILSISEEDFIKLVPVELLKSNIHWFDQFFYKQSINFLSRGKFSCHMLKPFKFSSRLRLIYLKKPIESFQKINTSTLNEYRTLLHSRIIIENGYFNVIGPIIQNDFYDYRILPNLQKFKSLGCILQSSEIKLTNFNDQTNSGDILIRGYNIGKTKTINLHSNLEVITPAQELAKKTNDGFMPLNYIKGKWGNDGCLYIYD